MDRYRMRRSRFYLLVLLLLSSSGVTAARWLALDQARDRMGGASMIFKRPENPPVHKRKPEQKQATESQPTAKPQDQALEAAALSDEVEDAIALGNVARDREPSDFQSAERAYRLASKLDPRDARAYFGLGNIYYDQKRFAEAADAYRKALQLAAPKMTLGHGQTFADVAHPRAKPIGSPRRLSSPPDELNIHSYAYLASSLLQEEDLTGAETVLRDAISADQRNSQFR
jgi:tetratricopeptide (TPR) repeat protein